MSTLEIGVHTDDFRRQTKDALKLASQMEFSAVELAAAAPEVDPSSLSASGRRHLRRYVDGLGLRMASLDAALPGLRFTDPRTVDERVERTCRILQLARDLTVPVVTASAGALTHPDTREPASLAVEALKRLGEFADAHDVVYALRPAYDSGDRIARVLDELDCPSLKICLDPAAMVISGADPVSVVERLPEKIALVHARDGTAGLPERAGRETRLGEGEVDLNGLFALLAAVEYTGPYIVRRTDSQTPISDLRAARDALLRLLPTK